MKKTIMVFAILSSVLLSGCWTTGKGGAQDSIYQIELDGLFLKTYNVWLTNDHPTGTSTAIYCPEPNNWDLIQKIQVAVKEKSKCNIYYHNEFIIAPWRCSSNTIIDDIECEGEK